MAVYEISRYPITSTLRDGSSVTLRPMEAGDSAGVLAFFRRIPEDERFFLKDDVTNPAVIDSWAEHLNYDRALPLLGFDGARVVANATLIRHRGGWRRDSAEIRVVIDPGYRSKGLGTLMMRELVNVAWDAELDYVEFEMIAGIQQEALEGVESGLGALRVGVLQDYVKDAHGNLHDLVFLRLPLGKWWQTSNF
ncbi:MAG: GNAT family N-acetyltransferase [Dehalococcoidia bacterium]|nr:GNAT family N-acetyltransferase [Dehalococcoidia bacterium]